MNRRHIALSLLLLTASGVGAQEPKSLAADAHNRYVEMPLDHRAPELGSFTLYYQLSSNFDFGKPTVFYIVDSQQSARDVNKLAARYQFSDSLNLVLIEYRGRENSHIDVTREDGSIDWEQAYHLLASHQAVEDIEAVRRDLFGADSDTKISLYGRSGGAYLIHEYLSKYSQHAARAFTRTAPNPLVMQLLGNPESKFFVEQLDEIDPGLHDKLKTVLARETVPSHDLLWLLLRLPYGDPDAPGIQAGIIEELYEQDTRTFDEYRAKSEYSLDFLRGEQLDAMLQEMGAGMLLRPLECDGPYLLGPEPEYVDPIYTSYRYISAPVFKLIEEQGFPAPSYPPLESYRHVEAEVFYLAGRSDHMSPWSIAVELANWFPNYAYFIADDTHTMSEHPDCYPLLRNAFFLHGLGSAELAEAGQSALCKEWIPD